MKVKKILISQPEPLEIEKSPYRNLITKYDLELTFFKFFEIRGLTASEFRKSRIHLNDYTAVIFNSKNAIDHYFRLAKELRITIPDTMKYFCSTEAIAFYLQNYIQYRKRKIFYGNQFFSDLLEVMGKHRDEKFIFPCSDEKQTEYTKLLDKTKFKYTKATMYVSVPRDMSHLNLKDFDMVCLFSPIGVRAMLHNFPDAAESHILVAAFGPSTHSALKSAGIRTTIAAPTKASPSMAMAIENYVSGKTEALGNSSSSRSSSRSNRILTSSLTSGRKSRSVIVNKEKYKQLQEQRKAQAAARRAERKAMKNEEMKNKAAEAVPDNAKNPE